MYIPKHFEENDTATLHSFLREHPLGILVMHGSEGLTANHVPFLLSANDNGLGILQAHVARANRVWEDALSGTDEALVIFSGASAYITPSWYPSKAEAHRVVPTYNYTAVHAHGRVTVRDDPKWLRANVGRLTRQFEAEQDQPWRMADAPADFLTAMIENIVGIEIVITRLEGKWKMSQNRSQEDQNGVTAGLRNADTPQGQAVAAEMAKRQQRADHG